MWKVVVVLPLLPDLVVFTPFYPYIILIMLLIRSSSGSDNFACVYILCLDACTYVYP